MDFERFFAMGGYAFYVWTSYGLALAVLAGNVVAAVRRKRRATELVTRLARQDGRAR